MKTILVFCGSSSGFNPIYQETAQKLGKLLATNNIRLIYGGGSVGLMKTVADAVLENGGTVTGVIPTFMEEWEVQHKNLTELIWVRSMHERKQMMADLADGIIALPGGMGTLDELFEILTWRQLGLHNKPVGLLNVNNYYKPLLEMIDTIALEGFMHEANKMLLLKDSEAASLLNKMKSYQPLNTPVDKWVDKR